ncbi:type II toxin-antitoxin system RelE family toxin [Brachybacterium aquaticum]|uniref:mRNA interferase RelE/StbE n=1 Tax=Brachybacterium aquaticum TaxID=1432564 RepID=A0A841AEN6_9MICO|nr:type II toxin-antitoxin system RelE/ParE family toxin [Brachybacterium aquaticum]MBB5832433.1 mRNA interferase RelE/StbE [Brachybacterium aquaticum]
MSASHELDEPCLTDQLPEAVAAAAYEFLVGPLLENPHRVGKALVGPLAGLHSARRGEYRVIYRIYDHRVLVEVVTIAHRHRFTGVAQW